MRRLQLASILLAAGILSAAFAPPVAVARIHAAGSAMQGEYEIGIDGPRGLVVSNREGLFRTLDAGSTWTKITPHSFTPIAYEHVFDIIAVGHRIWLMMEGADVWNVIPYSWNGGRTWHSGGPGGLGFLSDLTFTNGEDGWVREGRDNGSQSLYRTTNGGISWVVDRTAADAKLTSPTSIVGRSLPARGSTPDDLKIERAISAVGGVAWAQASGPDTPTYLLRSTDGGKTWQFVTGP